MAEDEQEQQETELAVPEIWKFAKPPLPQGAEDDEQAAKKRQTGPLVGKLVKYLNDIEDQEEFETKLQEKDPATGQSLILWATLTGKFVLVEWLIKKAKRAAFGFHNNDKEISIYDKWIEVRKEIEEKEKERLLHPPEEEEAGEDDEEKPPEPTADQLVFEALSDLHEELGARGPGIVKRIGELGIYQGARNQEGAKVGLGQTLFPNGDIYVGEYVDNKRHGTGTYYFADDGVIYIGSWRENLRDGIGRAVYPDGGRYFGNWAHDTKNGEGRYTYPDGGSYSGEWCRDVKHGFGTFTFPDGSQHIGTFTEGDFASGEWRLAGNTRYYGGFSRGHPTGKGVFVLKHGKEGSFRQEGSYENGVWVPGAIVAVDAPPQLELRIRNQRVQLAFTDESAGLGTENLVQAATYAPFLHWQRAMESQSTVFVQSAAVSSIRHTGKQVSEVRAKVTVVDAAGKRTRGTDVVVFKQPTTRVLVVLLGGDKTYALLQLSPNASLMQPEQYHLPSVDVAASGEYTGQFADIVGPALRLSLRKQNTWPLPGLQDVVVNGASSNLRTSVSVYIQQIHPDAFSRLQSRLDELTAKFKPLYQLRAVRLADVVTLSSDALTVITANTVSSLSKSGKLPTATVEAQRPPTPIPPAPEPRPDIEPLLEAERRARVVVVNDADE